MKEVRLTLRVPKKLYNRIINQMGESDVNISFNSYVLLCVERYLEKCKTSGRSLG